jgi:hypothetical protein
LAAVTLIDSRAEGDVIVIPIDLHTPIMNDDDQLVSEGQRFIASELRAR